MKTAISFLALVTFLSRVNAGEKPLPRTHSPFKSVILRGDTIVATLADNKKRWVRLGEESFRTATSGESFTIHSGQILVVSELRIKTWSYTFTPQFTPLKPGLSAICT